MAKSSAAEQENLQASTQLLEEASKKLSYAIAGGRASDTIVAQQLVLSVSNLTKGALQHIEERGTLSKAIMNAKDALINKLTKQ